MELIVWRHPRPQGVEGRCIGQVDVPVDRRKAKRLAHRIRHYARRERLFEQQAPVIWTSPLRRSFDVGRVLRSWGWVQRVDARLSELNFGGWDGQAWSQIAKEDIDAWCDNFADARPGEGESVSQLLARCGEFLSARQSELQPQPWCCLVGHAGWISSLMWIRKCHKSMPTATDWPAAIGYLQQVLSTLSAANR